METKLGKKDLILILVIAIAALAVWGISHFTGHSSGSTVKVTVDGEVYGTYSLDKDQDIPIIIDGNETNHLVISDGSADMTEADCPDQICVNESPASTTADTIVCLPNKVVVSIVNENGGSDDDLDAIAQ